MKSNIDQKNSKSKKQEISDKRYKFGKNNIMCFAILIITLLSMQIKCISAEKLNYEEKIEKAKKDIVWLDNKYDDVYYLGNTLIGVKDDENNKYIKVDFFDKDFKKVNASRYFDEKLFSIERNFLFGYSGNIVVIKKDEKYGLADKNGREIIKPKYSNIDRFSEELLAVELDYKWGFVDKTGKEVIEPKYDFINGLSDGLALVRKELKIGFIDKNGKEVIPPKYRHAYRFSEGMAAVTEDDFKYGFIDTSGKEVVKRKYDNVNIFKEGMA